jgi:hypothetical protein
LPRQPNGSPAIEEYDSVIWLSEIPREAGCHCAAWEAETGREDNEAWVEIRKPRLAPPPEPPALLKQWIDDTQLADSSREFPELRDSIVIKGELDEDESLTVAKLADHADIKALWKDYLAETWSPWAEQDRRAQQLQMVYTNLFSIYQKQHRLAELYEVVLSLGFLTWKKDAGREVKRHIVTAQANLEFDAKRGVLTVSVGTEGAKLRIEQDMLDPQDQPSAEQQNVFEQELADAGDDVWTDGRVKAVVQGWITALCPTSRFENSLSRQTTVDSTPRMHLAPALVLRRRTERSLIQVFENIKKDREFSARLREA